MTEKKTTSLSLEDFEIEAEHYLDGFGLNKEEVKDIAECSFREFNWDLLATYIFECMDTIIYNNYNEYRVNKLGEKLNKGELR